MKRSALLSALAGVILPAAIALAQPQPPPLGPAPPASSATAPADSARPSLSTNGGPSSVPGTTGPAGAASSVSGPGSPVASASAVGSARASAGPVGSSSAPLPVAVLGSRSSADRLVPDYDGRGGEPTTVGDVFLWVPRVIFFVPYLVTEYLLRRPIGWFVSTAERNQWPDKLVEFFTFGPDRNAGIFPTAFFDFGIKPSVGVYAWWDGVGPKENSLRFKFGTWGVNWLSFVLTDRITFSKNASLSFTGSWITRPDHPFYGLGPRSTQDDLSRYSSTVKELSILGDVTPTRWARIRASSGVRGVEFANGDCCDDPSITVLAAQHRFDLPPGFSTGYTDVYQRLELILDSRPRRPAVQHGVRVALEAEQGTDARHSNGARWLRWGGTAGAYLDLGGLKVIGLKTTILFAEALHGDIPFTEQIRLGGVGPMSGYLLGRLVDRSAAVVDVEYRWPVWVFLDGTMQAAVGNVFGDHLDGFAAKLLRLSAAIGVKSNNSADHQFEILTGLGTETWDDGLKVTSFRLVFGGTSGF